MTSIANTTTATIRAPIEEVFDFVTDAETPRKVMLRTGPVPAYVRGDLEQEGWGKPGDGRRVTLDDGAIIREQITAFEQPDYFEYLLSNFGSYMRFLVREARGQWWFERLPGGATHVRWIYTFKLASPLVAPVFLPFVRLFYRRYMRNGMDLTKALIERPTHAG